MRNVVFYGASTLFPRLFAFLALFVYSRFLSVHDFGLYVFAIATGELCDYLCANWMRVGLLRFYHGPTARGGAVNLTRAYGVCLGCTGVALLAAWPMAAIFVRDDWLHFALVISLYIVGNGAGQLAASTLRAEQRPGTYLFLESIRPLATFTAGCLVLLAHQRSYFPLALAAFATHAGIGVTALVVLWSRRLTGPPSVEVKGMAIYAWPMAFALGLNAMIMSSDRYVLQALLGPAAVALYSVAYSLGRQPLDIISYAFNLGGFSDLMRTFDKDGPGAAAALMRRQLTFLIGLLVPGCVGLTLLASPLIHVLFDHRYWDHTPELIGVVAVAAVFAGIKMSGFDQVFHMRRRADIYAWSLAPAALLTPGLGALLIWTMGLKGAAVGGLLGYAISCVVGGRDRAAPPARRAGVVRDWQGVRGRRRHGRRRLADAGRFDHRLDSGGRRGGKRRDRVWRRNPCFGYGRVPQAGFEATSPPLARRCSVNVSEANPGSEKPPVIAIHIGDLEGGGAERVCLTVADHLVRRGYDVDIVLCRANGSLVKDVPPSVRLVNLGACGSITSLGRVRTYLRTRRPVVMIANLVPQNTMATLAAIIERSPTRVYVTQHSALSQEVWGGLSPWRWLSPLLYRFALPSAQGVIAVSAGVAQDMQRVTGFPASRVQIIYNPIDTPSIMDAAHEAIDDPFFATDEPILVGVARLVPKKGFGVMIAAFARLSTTRSCRLAICGTGSDRKSLEAQIASLGLQDRVKLLGFQTNPFKYMAAANVFVLSSVAEGFGNVLVEAMACGTPVVSTDCPHGPREILDGGRFGELTPVGNVEALAAAMARALDNPLPGEVLIARAKEFSAETAVDKYLDVVGLPRIAPA